MKNGLFLCLLFLMASCSHPNYKWEIYNSDQTKLKSGNESFTQILSDENNLYLLGCIEETLNWTETRYVIYKSSDKGKSWEKILDGNGNIVGGFISAHKIFFLQENYIENSFRGVRLSLNLLDLKSKTTNKVHEFKPESSFVAGSGEDSGKGFIILKNGFKNDSCSLFKTEDYFKDYDSISIKPAVSKMKYASGNFYASSFKGNNLYKIDNRNKIDSLNLNGDIKDFSIDTNESILVLSQDENKIELKEVVKNEIIKKFAFQGQSHSHGQSIYKYGNFIAVIIRKKSSIGSIYKLFVSFNNGSSFKEEELPIDDYISPVYFYKDKYIVMYSGGGRISFCNLKDN